MAEGCVMVAPGAKGSFPSSTEDATKPKNIIALSNPHTRTTGFQGTRIRMAEPRGTKSGSRLRLLYCEKTTLAYGESGRHRKAVDTGQKGLIVFYSTDDSTARTFVTRLLAAFLAACETIRYSMMNNA